MPTLYELSDQMQEIQSLIDSGEMSEEMLADTLDGIEGMYADKTERIGFVILNQKAQAAALEAEIERLTKRKDAALASAEYLNGYLRVQMQKNSQTKIHCQNFDITLRKKPPSVIILDQSELPEKYIVPLRLEPVEPRPDKRKILSALKEGHEIPGAALVTNVPSVVIK